MTKTPNELSKEPTNTGPAPKSQTDPISQIGNLQECFSNNKRHLGLFLGAGCPMGIREGEKPLIPDIAGLTAKVISELAAEDKLLPLIQNVLAQFALDGKPDPTIEHILSHIRSLRSVAGAGEVRGLTFKNLGDLDGKICDIIHDQVNKALPNHETPYHSLASWVEAIERERPVEVFTTNYDLLMEQAFEDVGVPYFDGFAGARKPFFDLESVESEALPPRWARLWKLHGSINWFQIPGRGVFRGTPGGHGGEQRVIHPSHLKYEQSRRMPYLAMIDRLRTFLKRPANALVMCGYSFRDEHINEVIVQGLQATPSAVTFVLLFGGIATHPEAVELAKHRTNLNLLAEDGAVISGEEFDWVRKQGDSLGGSPATKWIKWVPVGEKENGGTKRAALKLGDFAVFGQFLKEIIGPTIQRRWTDGS